jgi:hypothetical protein
MKKKSEEIMKIDFIIKYSNKFLAVLMFILIIASVDTNAQWKNKWMSVGSLQSWYSEIGSELEEQGFVKSQQEGLAYPAIYRYQDMIAMKGHWVGAANFTDEKGNFYPVKVVTMGPRNPQFWAVFPEKFELISKFEAPVVSVDGNVSYQKDVSIDRLDPSMKWDRMLDNVIHTQLGITIRRKIYQFSAPKYDNFIVYEYTYKNTGNTDADPTTIELPNNTITGAYFFFSYRYSVNKQARYAIGNSTGWGKNTMVDTRGDGVEVDPANESFRCQFAWHGFSPEKEVPYDNIGGPVWSINSNAAYYLDKGDTVGRLAAWQFVGNITLHADKSATDKTDDKAQPATTTWEDSDRNEYLAGNNAFNVSKMQLEYSFMSAGHKSPRHAKVIQPDGNYAAQAAAPYLSGTGGTSCNNAYGPYTLAPGDSITIVMAEAADGMGYDAGLEVGKKFKLGTITALQKNQEVMKGKDSLMATFKRISDAYATNWASVPTPPKPPKIVDIKSGGDRISLSWSLYDGESPAGYEIWRASGNTDSTYHLIATLPAGTASYNDVALSRGFDYYYYISAIGSDGSKSSRYYSQSYDPARLKRKAGLSLSEIRVVPNPYNSAATPDKVRFPGGAAGDRIAFYDIPGECSIKIYTEMGELIKTIEHSDGSGDEFWNQVTSSGQIVVSGVYIGVITDNKTGDKHTVKFVIIR